nr:glycine betaine ABC transporter substrate-binding protein [Spelaeicoccus albus]
MVLGGCGLSPATAYVPKVAPGTIKEISGLPDDAQLTIVGKNFTEQLILAKMAVLAVEAAGFKVKDMTDVPGSQPVRDLMLSGKGDMTWEYTGTAWLTYMNKAHGIPNQHKQWLAVRKADKKNGLTWLKPAPLNNTYAIAIKASNKKKLDGITKLSQIADLPVKERTFCVESEFNSRSDGMNPMLKKYGIKRGTPKGVPNSNVKILDTGAVYSATAKGLCNFGEVFASDGRIASLNLQVLKDDKHFFPAYNATPIVNSQTLKQYPQLKKVFGQIAPHITTSTMQTLNRKVDVDGEEPANVAFDWMVKKGFIKKP